MANANKPSGLTPVKYLNGADWTGQANMYYIDNGDGSVFTPGDLVKLSGSGDATRGIPGISKSAAGDASVGVLIAVGTNPDGGPYIEPTRENFQNRTYPLTRSIFIYLNRPPGQPVDPKSKEFLRYILSREGQEAVQREGKYLPLTAEVAREQLKKLD